MSRYIFGSGKFDTVSGYSAQMDSPLGTASLKEKEPHAVIGKKPIAETELSGPTSEKVRVIPKVPEKVILKASDNETLISSVEKYFGKYWFVWLILAVILLTR